MTAFSEGTQYITLLLPIRETQTTTVQKHKQQPKLQIKSVNRFSGDDSLQGLGSDSSLVGCDTSIHTFINIPQGAFQYQTAKNIIIQNE